MGDCQPRTTATEIGYKPPAMQPELGDQPFNTRTNQQAISWILYAALGTCPGVTYATSVSGRYASQPSTLHWEAVKHLLRYLRGTSDYNLMIYDPSLGHDSSLWHTSQSILCYANAELG